MKSPSQKSPVMNLENMNAAFAEAYNSGDIDNLLALYEPGTVLINLDGCKDQGMDLNRKTLEDLFRL